MKNFKLSTIINFIFLNLIVFFFSLMWLKFIFKSVTFSLSLSFFVLIFINTILICKTHKKNINNKLLKNLQIDIDNYFLTLLSNTKEENLYFFYNILKTDDTKVIKSKNLIIINDNKNIIKIVCPMFQDENLSFETAIKQIAIAKKINPNEIIILCNNIDQKIKFRLDNLNNLPLKIFSKLEVYNNIFKKYNRYPKITYTQKSKLKLNLKLLYILSFQKSNAKKFFFSGFFLFFCSFFIRNNIFYILFSSILFFFSFICLFNNSKNFE